VEAVDGSDKDLFDLLSFYLQQSEQWTASLSVWNRDISRSSSSFSNEVGLDGSSSQQIMPVSASFESRDVPFVKLYWEDQV
jgi:hypothetical protein